MAQDELNVEQVKQVVLKQASIEQNIGDLKYQVQLMKRH